MWRASRLNRSRPASRELDEIAPSLRACRRRDTARSPRDDDAVREGLPEPSGKRKSVLVVDRVLVLAEKHRQGPSFVSTSPHCRPQSPTSQPVAQNHEGRRPTTQGGDVVQAQLTREELAQAAARGGEAHGEYEQELGRRDEDWPGWYADYILRRLEGGPLRAVGAAAGERLGAAARRRTRAPLRRRLRAERVREPGGEAVARPVGVRERARERRRLVGAGAAVRRLPTFPPPAPAVATTSVGCGCEVAPLVALARVAAAPDEGVQLDAGVREHRERRAPSRRARAPAGRPAARPRRRSRSRRRPPRRAPPTAADRIPGGRASRRGS